MIASTDEKRYFESLDLLRGLAAIVVLVYHSDFMFGLRHELLAGGYLAVDLFFVLSGFVLSLNYGSKLVQKTVTFRDFLIARIARLYPLFVITTVVGFAVMTTRFKSNFGYIDTVALIKSGLVNLLMLPSGFGAYNSPTLFPFNAATWSIFFEMVASLIFFFYLGRAGMQMLVATAIGAGVVLIALIVIYGTVDLGYATTNLLAGFPRVLFSFTVGMLIQRVFARTSWQVSRPVFYGLLIALLVLMQAKILAPTSLYDIFAVVVFLPLLVIASVGATLENRQRSIALFFGETSYAVYLTQGPLIIISAGLAQALTGQKIYDLGAWVGFVFVPIAVLISYMTYRLFERPARLLVRQFGSARWLRSADSLPPSI